MKMIETNITSETNVNQSWVNMIETNPTSDTNVIQGWDEYD